MILLHNKITMIPFWFVPWELKRPLDWEEQSRKNILEDGYEIILNIQKNELGCPSIFKSFSFFL